MIVTRDKIQGMFFGIGIGDGLFMPAETMNAAEIKKFYGRITTYIRPDGHKWFNGREAGMWTDDMQYTLAVAESLIVCRGINMDDMAARHVSSMQQEGDFGLGKSTRNAIQRLAEGIHWSQSGITDADKPRQGAGNGIAMKIAPIGAYRASPYASPYCENYAKVCNRLLTDILHFTYMTHRTMMAIDSALAHIAAIHNCLITKPENFSVWEFIRQVNISTLFAYPFEKESGSTNTTDNLAERLVALRSLPLNELDTNDFIKLFGGGTSYAYHSLPFSYAFFLKNPFSIERLYDVGNAGGDTDTNASIVGGLLGALNGMSIFPAHLTNGIWQKERIANTAKRFCDTFEIAA